MILPEGHLCGSHSQKTLNVSVAFGYDYSHNYKCKKRADIVLIPHSIAFGNDCGTGSPSLRS